jgi:hypothetical protein
MSHRNFSHTSNFLFGTTLFDDLNLDIIIDEELKTWKEIVNNMFKMREQYSGTGELVEGDSWLEIQDDNTHRILKLEFKDCMIESIGDLEYNSTSEDEIMTLPVTIKYDYYEIFE